jgi:hypothetical protein
LRASAIVALSIYGSSVGAFLSDTTPQPASFKTIETEWNCSIPQSDQTMRDCTAVGLFQNIGGRVESAIVTFTAPSYKGSPPPPECSDVIPLTQPGDLDRASCHFGVFKSDAFDLIPLADVTVESQPVAASPSRGSASIDWVAVGAGATLFTGLVALFIAVFGTSLQTLLFKPKLRVSIEMRPPDCTKIRAVYGTRVTETGTEPTSFVDSYYYRLQITNTGNREAQDVEVRLLRLQVTVGAESKEDRDFFPLNLKWSNTGQVTAPRIQPKLSKHCDLCQILGNDPGFIEFVTEVTPNPLRPGIWATKKPAGVYRLVIAVAANNASVVEKTLRISFVGWRDDEAEMLSEGLVVELV